MKKIWSQTLASDRLYLFYFGFGLVYFTLYRILFLITYQYRMETWDLFVLLKIFLLGIRFDTSTVAILLVSFVLLSKINFLSKIKLFRSIWIFGPIIILPIVSLHLFADLIYFENANKHIGYEAIVFLGDLPILTKSILSENPLAVSALVLFFAFYIWIVFKISRRKKLSSLEDQKSTIRSQILRAFVWILFCFLAFRGGIQESPLRASEAIISEDPFVNQLALNGVYTTINDLKSQSIPKHLKLSREEALAIVKEEIAYPSAEFLESNEFPILRRTIPNPKSKIKNIVLVIQESWTGKYVWPVGTGIWEGKEITPNYNKLAKRGHSFTKFYANGGRTSNALLSILTSIPDRPGLTAIRTPQVLSQFSALGNLFTKLGYRTSFLTGDDLKFDSLQTILPHFGFKHLTGKQEIFKDGRFLLGAWGFDDEVLFTLAEEEMDLAFQNQEPFFMTILTMTTHYPYKVPDPKFNLYDNQVQDFDYLNTYHYSDWALGEYIKKMEKKDYFDSTVFLFVGDHTHHRYLSYFEDRMVPFLIYSPKNVTPKKDERIASQLDVLPTILGFLNTPIEFSGFGKNLRDPSVRSGTTYFAYGSACGWISESKILYQSVDGNTQFIFEMNPPYGVDRLCNEDRKNCNLETNKAKAIFNLSLDLMNQNSIFPKDNTKD